jgi:hypothetical protein
VEVEERMMARVTIDAVQVNVFSDSRGVIDTDAFDPPTNAFGRVRKCGVPSIFFSAIFWVLRFLIRKFQLEDIQLS